MNKLIKNKVLLFYIFCFNPAVIFAESTAFENIQEEESKNKIIAQLEEENALLELQMKNKCLKIELQKKQKEAEEWEAKNRENEESKFAELEIKKIRREIDLLQNKHNLFLARQWDSEESRKQSKINLEITNEKKNLEAAIELAKREMELKNIKHAREQIVEDDKIEYLDDPLLENGTLVLSDRQILLDFAITASTAEKIEQDIDFFNNKNDKQPIFLIIDRCHGGMTDAGSIILDKINNSKAPVYVVVKRCAASMAAIITTLARRSFCFKNTVFIHHQPFRPYILTQMNVREHEEALKSIREIWERIVGPVAEKMGIGLKTFMKRMYEKNSQGDWIEFGDKAKKLNWVDNVITNIRDTSVKTKFDDQISKDKKSIKENLTNKENLTKFVKAQNESNEFSPNDCCYMYIPEKSNMKLTYHK
ncbi:MAG: ATP-dependent Clp protease proteolytic subunit [Cytophagales bacterium]|jgi:ATP-dependent Clp protease protease subunit|nr:ATP-dependent Clp protease proteolytic subunit [Cytophagales bacterium]